jgi:hypothetical protein
LSDTYEYDFFISHASEDKAAIARPLAEELRTKGYKVWYDEYELTIGDSLLASIDSGLASSRFGVVILSRSFFAKHWPRTELDGLVALEEKSRKIVLPVWHEVDKQYVKRYSPTLAGKYAVSTDKGLGQVISAIEAAYQKDSSGLRRSATVSFTANDSSEKALLLLGTPEGRQLEDQVFTECMRNGSERILRTMAMEFSALRRALVDGRNVAGLVGEEAQQALASTPIEILGHSVRNSVAVRVGLASARVKALDRELGDELFDLYAGLFRRSDGAEAILSMQRIVMHGVFAMGAYAIAKRLPSLARSFLGRGNPVDSFWEDRPWFRYIGSQLAEREIIKKTVLRSVKEYWDDSGYFEELVGDEDAIWGHLCQFDFLQCIDVILSGNHISDCFASFSVFRRYRVQPFVEELISTYDEGIWIQPVSSSELAKAIVALDVYAGKWAGFEYDAWAIDRWSSAKIRMFLTEQGYEVR